jgi:hypothetical protein
MGGVFCRIDGTDVVIYCPKNATLATSYGGLPKSKGLLTPRKGVLSCGRLILP